MPEDAGGAAVNESTLKAALVKALRAAVPDGVVIRHEDTFTGGIPDVSVTRRGRVAWLEVKYQRLGRKAPPTALQKMMLGALGGALVTYTDLKSGSRVTEVYDFAGGETALYEIGKKYAHEAVARWAADRHQVASDLEQVRRFSRRFGIPMAARPTMDRGIAERRYHHMREELWEYRDAMLLGDLPKFADALADLVYVALGAALELGIPWERVFAEVHAANMRKVRLDDGRGHKLGVGKPPGWAPPDVEGALRAAGWEAGLPPSALCTVAKGLEEALALARANPGNARLVEEARQFARRPRSVRSVVEEHGLDVKPSRDEVDRATGRRMGPEPEEDLGWSAQPEEDPR